MADLTSFEVGRLWPPIKSIADSLMNASQVTGFMVNILAMKGYYNFSTMDVNGNMLSPYGSVVLNRTGASQYTRARWSNFGRFDGAADGFTTGDTIFQITGLETSVDAAYRGLTCGAWVRFSSLTGAQTALGIWGNSPNKSYRIEKTSTQDLRFAISDLGVSSTWAQLGGVIQDAWYFVAGRFTPGRSIDLFCNGTKVSTTTAFASAFNSTSQFRVAYDATSSLNWMEGDIAHVFVCAAALPDEQIDDIYKLTATTMPI